MDCNLVRACAAIFFFGHLNALHFVVTIFVLLFLCPFHLSHGKYCLLQKDMRNPSHSGYRWSVAADVESLAWDPHTGHSFVVSVI